VRTCAVLLAAGAGARFGGDKVTAPLGDRPVWRWSFDRFHGHPDVDGVGIVASTANLEEIRAQAPDALFVVEGGANRRESSRIGAQSVPPGTEIVLIHDAARPFCGAGLIGRVVRAAIECGAAAPGVRILDTVREVDGEITRVLDRDRLVAMQTPQGARLDLLLRAHREVELDVTDDLALLEATGVRPQIVEGERENFKITLPEDWERARRKIGGQEHRTGLGYDVHAFSKDPDRPLVLGGVGFEGAQGLEGHSDADVLLHAAVDALLGAAALGDIGQHFPNTDPRWKDEPSTTFLEHARHLLGAEGWRIVHLDIAVLAERPKIMGRAEEMRETIASHLQIETSRVSVKATTNEGLGAIGRGEGIAAFATATITRI
jgi:2-C-methyl-D-erythritol 4-phosphate cytidylyltransferase / 2-C-methyl-D-erythritol 2,4-cyclodiphosphate synthase